MPRVDTIEMPSLSQGTWIISDDGQGLAVHIAERLYNEGKKVLLLAFPSSLVKRQFLEVEKNYKFIQLRDSSLGCLESTMKEIIDLEPRIEGFIHVHPRSLSHIKHIQEAFNETDYHLIQSVFFTAKHLATPFNQRANPREANFIAVTQLDGKLGLAKSNPFHIMPGALPGLTKSLAREWKGVFARSIDISPQLAFSSAAKMICDELKDADSEILEVGIDSEGKRWQPELISTDVVLAHDTLDSNTVFLVSGGGRGITADCVIALAKKIHAKFVLLGRTDIREAEPGWAQGFDSEEELKKAAINHMMSMQIKPKPVEIEKIIKMIL
ncbi:MAG: family NAD(P)-dependent oxidoreductase, partial [Gammaproteobacteria bacterium]|nr:family NAD(P)-dependent oxidoreductase [Gammaproteobacteria bacterium]